jgi:hypothetical protein
VLPASVGRVGNMADEQRGLGGTVHDRECEGMVGPDRRRAAPPTDCDEGGSGHRTGLGALLVNGDVAR